VIRALLDTSVVIASGDALRDESEATAAISVLTIGELQAGVRLAKSAQTRAERQARLNAIRAMFEPIAVDETIAYAYGELLAFARSQRRTTNATDLLIIASASATGRTLLTLDGPQESLARSAGVAVNP
jgi:predicted nucleic acid-binding protein